jgi:6-phosphofructokinase 1
MNGCLEPIAVVPPRGFCKGINPLVEDLLPFCERTRVFYLPFADTRQLYCRLMKSPQTLKHIAVLTSGGDAPGMNAAIRAVVRTSIYEGLRVSASYKGYQGLIDDTIEELGARSVANIIQRGGTILKTARCMPFYESEGRSVAAKHLKEHGIEGLVVIGGDGSFRGATKLHEEHGIAVIGIPGTIDNDIYGTDVSIGFNTAMNIALDAIDRLRDTAASHDRLFLVEVMGRHSGQIALNVGLAGGAEVILLPELKLEPEEIVAQVINAKERGKSSSIIVVAEGAYPGGALGLQKELEASCGYEVRSSILGHMQRGGSPSTRDRVLASRLGYMAVQGLLEGQSGVMVGVDKRGTVFIPLTEVFDKKKEIDMQLYEIAKVLAI